MTNTFWKIRFLGGGGRMIPPLLPDGVIVNFITPSFPREREREKDNIFNIKIILF